MESFVHKDKFNTETDVAVYKALHKVISDNAYSNITLNEALNSHRQDAAYITKLFYGVLDKYIQFDYIISQYVDKKPRQSIELIIKMGLYKIMYMNIPPYAAVDNSVKLCKTLGKSGVSGFVNAVLRKTPEFKMPSKDELDFYSYYSIVYSYPKWAIEKLAAQYGKDFVENFFSAEIRTDTHIRRNITEISDTEFTNEIETAGYQNRTYYGYYVTHKQMERLNSNHFIIQSFPSVASVYSLLSNIKIKNVLDLCSAPGGKAILIKQLTNASITACDIYPHRTELIKKFAEKTGLSDLKIIINDALKLKTEWMRRFDFVLCDVPCSNFGVISSKPDIVLNKTSEKIEALKNIQAEILNVAANYVMPNGYLAYSTCTVFKDENDDIIKNFLSSHNDFFLDNMDNEFTENGMVKIFPQKHNCGAFFAARLRRRA